MTASALTPFTSAPLVDRDRAQAAVAELLAAFGQDPSGPHLEQTPRRVVDAFAEMLAPEPFTFTTFPNDEGYGDLVLVREVAFTSLCEHHLLPFRGVAHIGYVPGERIVGLSKLARVVEWFARRLQVQERMTTQIADHLEAALAPRGVGVVVQAEHLCMSLRGVRATRAHTTTSVFRGRIDEDERMRAQLLA